MYSSRLGRGNLASWEKLQLECADFRLEEVKRKKGKQEEKRKPVASTRPRKDLAVSYQCR